MTMDKDRLDYDPNIVIVGNRLKCKKCGAKSKRFALSIKHKQTCKYHFEPGIRTVSGGLVERNRRRH
jgi:hypothetical protein